MYIGFSKLMYPFLINPADNAITRQYVISPVKTPLPANLILTFFIFAVAIKNPPGTSFNKNYSGRID